MPRSKIWQPIVEDELPAGLKYALELANQTSKRNWRICKQQVVEVAEVSSAELTRLKEQVRVLQSQIERYRSGKAKVIIDPQVEIYEHVKNTVMLGRTFNLRKSEYPAYREVIQMFAAELESSNQSVYRNIALNEIRRLDRLHGYKEEAGESTLPL